MRIKVNIKLNPQAIKKIEKAMLPSLSLTMEAMKSEVNSMQVVPKETGALEESISTGVEGAVGYISYNTPYARKLYYHPEYNFRTDKNPNAQGRWLDDFIHGKKKKWIEETYGNFLKVNSGGVIK